MAGGGFAVTTFKSTAGGQKAQKIVIDPGNADTACIVTDTQVFMTVDGGTSWTALTDNLSQMYNPDVQNFNGANGGPSPARGLVLFTNGTATPADDVLLVGGPGGVFRRLVQPLASFGSNTWQPLGAGSTMPNVLVTSLQYDAPTDALLAGTFGRGAWLLSNASQAIQAPFPAPQVVGLAVTPNAISEGSSVTLTGSFNTANPLTSPTVVVNWGDGSASSVLTVPAQVFTFSATHAYLNNLPVGQSSGALALSVTVSETSGISGSAGIPVTVANVAPVLGNLAAPSVAAGWSVRLSGTITDPGPLDTFTLQVS